MSKNQIAVQFLNPIEIRFHRKGSEVSFSFPSAVFLPLSVPGSTYARVKNILLRLRTRYIFDVRVTQVAKYDTI